jgi:predicted hydrocarbon binding protein
LSKARSILLTLIDKSGYYYPNRAGRIFLEALEEVMGKNGVSAILNMAGLETRVDNYPPDDLERQFDFAEFAAINATLDELYGPQGGRGLARRAGWATFNRLLKNFGALVGVGDLAFKILPTPAKIKIGLPALARVFSQISDQDSSVREDEKYFFYIVHRCPICWGRSADKPVCYVWVGLLEESLHWLAGDKHFRVEEQRCIAQGDEVCEFRIDKVAID